MRIAVYIFIILVIGIITSCLKKEEFDNLTVTGQESGVTFDLHCITFPSTNIGYAGGRHGQVIKTTNGGSSWVQVRDSSSFRYTSGIYFENNVKGIIIDKNNKANTVSMVHMTLDGGVTWSNTDVEGMTEMMEEYQETVPFEGSYFFDDQAGIAVMTPSGYNQNKFVTKYDEGPEGPGVDLPTRLEYDLYDVEFTGANSGFACGDNSLLFTSDGGITWLWLRDQHGTNISKDAYSTENYYGIHLFSSTSGILVGEAGAVVTFIK